MAIGEHVTIGELLEGGVPREELIAAITRGELGEVVAARRNDDTLLIRTSVAVWLAMRSHEPWASALKQE